MWRWGWGSLTCTVENRADENSSENDLLVHVLIVRDLWSIRIIGPQPPHRRVGRVGHLADIYEEGFCPRFGSNLWKGGSEMEKGHGVYGREGAGDHKGSDKVHVTVVFQAVNRRPIVHVSV